MKKVIFTLLASMFAIFSYAQIGIGTITPNSTLDVRGSVATSYRAFTTTTTATATDNLLVFTGSSATTITLPTAVGCDGRTYMIKNASTTGPTPVLTIATTAAQTIDAAGSWTLTSANETVTLISNGANWNVSAQSLPGGSGVNWTQNGNSVASLKSIGTINNFSLPFITNNTEKMRLTSTGSLGIGTATFNATNPEKLVVDAGTTTSVNAIVGKGSIDSYLQLNIQNNSAGTNASSDVVATANNGSETTNFVDMGINGGSNSSGVMGTANDAYLYNIGQNLLIGAGSTSKSLVFMTGGTTQSTNERMRIDGSGNVGIGITNPAYKLQVNAASNPLFLGGVQTGANTDSLLTIINGVVKKIHTSALPSSGAWSLTGNNNTLASNHFLGTTNTDPLIIKTNSIQVGRFNQNSLALGLGATTNNATQSYAFGSGATVGFNKTGSMALGNNSAINSDSSFAIGTAAVVNGANSFAIGNGAAANNDNSLAIGRNAFTAYSITDAVALGTNATANASNSIAIGSNSVLAGKTTTNATSAIALGNGALSNSTNAIAIGTGSGTGYNLTNPIAIGVNTLATGNNAVVIGNGAITGFVDNATVIGAGASVNGTGNNSTAIGYNASATLPNEIILGDRSNTSLSVGIGTESFSGSHREKLLVDAGITTSVNAIVGKGSIDSYLQLNIQNNSAGTSASSDVVATANNGNETSNYVDMGINGGSYTGGIMGGANDGYLYTMGNNFLLGTGNASKSLIFMTGGTSQAANERARIDGSGNMGIGTPTPSQKLDVNGNLRLSGAFMPGNTAGTAGQFLVSAGAGAAPTWYDASGYAWLINGNSVPSIKTIGTTNNFDLPFITNNTEKMRITSAGDVGIGTSTFNGTYPEQLLVNAGTPSTITDYQNVIVGKGNTNSYAQLNIQNTYSAAGNSASSDVVATSDNGNESVNFIDMGINSGTNTTTGILGGGNTAYLYGTGNNFVIGNSTAAKDIILFTGGTAVANERMRINGSGLVGIGNNNPTSTLSVTGSTAHSIVTKTANYTATANDYTIVCNNSGAITISLPAASGAVGRVYVIKKTSAILNNVTIDPNASETIDGIATRTLTIQYESVVLQSDGTNWFVLSNL